MHKNPFANWLDNYILNDQKKFQINRFQWYSRYFGYLSLRKTLFWKKKKPIWKCCDAYQSRKTPKFDHFNSVSERNSSNLSLFSLFLGYIHSFPSWKFNDDQYRHVNSCNIRSNRHWDVFFSARLIRGIDLFFNQLRMYNSILRQSCRDLKLSVENWSFTRCQSMFNFFFVLSWLTGFFLNLSAI